MRGFQLWINLPSREKMKPAAYRDIPSREIPTVALAGGVGIAFMGRKTRSRWARWDREIIHCLIPLAPGV